MWWLACISGGDIVLDDTEVSDADTDTDTDTDTDADADADADSDADTDLPDWYLYKARLDARVRGGELVDPSVLEATFYPSGWSETNPLPTCTQRYTVASSEPDGERWTMELQTADGDCVAGEFDPLQDVDRFIVGVDTLTWDLEEDLSEDFPDWTEDWKPYVLGAHFGVDSTRENGWAFRLKVDDDLTLVPGDNCAVAGATCLDTKPNRYALQAEVYYFLFVDDF